MQPLTRQVPRKAIYLTATMAMGKHGLPTGSKQYLAKSPKAGHDTESVNFSKNIFDTYATSFPVTTVEYKFSEYQVERLVEKEKDDRPDFQGPLISFLNPGVD